MRIARIKIWVDSHGRWERDYIGREPNLTVYIVHVITMSDDIMTIHPVLPGSSFYNVAL